MNIIRQPDEIREQSRALKRANHRVALVPTMGALHAGHVALIQAAHARDAAVIVSLYVNPAQFGPREDLESYPRDFAADQAVCEREGVTAILAPDSAAMYQADASTWVTETALARRLEGERRPQFFRGVCTVVAKLFNIVQPDLAMFGRKDYQQLKVIERMTRDLAFPVEIVAVPTAREADGLACSSRNQYLDANQRAQATVLFKALNVARDLFEQGETNPYRLQAAMARAIDIAPAARVDYAELVDPETFEPKPEVRRGDVALVAAYLDKTRLIDNLTL